MYKVFGHVATRVHVLVSEGCDFLLMFPPIMLHYTKSSCTDYTKQDTINVNWIEELSCSTNEYHYSVL